MTSARRHRVPILIAGLPAILLAMPGWSDGTALAIELLPTDAAGFVGLAARGPLDTPTAVDGYTQFVDVFGASADGLANPHLAPAVAGFFANGGTRAWVVRVADAGPATLIGSDGGAPGSRTGLQALLDVDSIAMVAIPGAVTPAVQNALIAHAAATGDRMAILDPVSPDDLAAVIDQRGGLHDPDGRAALYFPWLEAEPAGDPLVLPPSGLVAGVYARTAPPDSPVGDVVTATGVTYAVSSGEQEILTPLGINAIRAFPGSGVLVWGARTLADAQEFRYVAVRRTALVLRESIHDGTAWALDEPNDETVWAQLVADVEDFLYGLWSAGWFQGATPDQAFFVRCDRTTMTQQDIDAGRTIILVGFAPVAPAEFVVLQIVHERTAVSVAPAPGPAVPAARLLQASPNPFNPRTTLRFELPRAATVRLAVHDPSGVRVRVLVDGERLDAGVHRRIWNGRDTGGAAVASGVYLIRLVSGSEVLVRTLTLVR